MNQIYWRLLVCSVLLFSADFLHLTAGEDKLTILPDESVEDFRIGIIGLDTSHSVAFTEILNSKECLAGLEKYHVVAAYPHGSRDIESSVSRIPQYTKQVEEMGVEIVSSISELLERVDGVLLETNDGRLHLEQVLPVLKAGKPVFIDKPMAASLADVIAIFMAAEHYGTPAFSTSPLRYGEETQAVRNGAIGKVLGCDTYSPCLLEPTHPDLFWYGVHGVEALFTIMGTGCESVQCNHLPDADVVVGKWKDGRLGTFRGTRTGQRHYGGIAFGEKSDKLIGQDAGYRPLVVDIVHFFQHGRTLVKPEETIEIFAFMQAAQESKLLDGASVSLEYVLQKARSEAKTKQIW